MTCTCEYVAACENFGLEFDLSKPCGKVSVVSRIAVDQGGCRTKSQRRDEAIRVGPPGAHAAPLDGITPQFEWDSVATHTWMVARKS